MESKDATLIKEAIEDINDALSCVDELKEGLGLRGQSHLEDCLEAAKTRLRRILLSDIGEL